MIRRGLCTPAVALILGALSCCPGKGREDECVLLQVSRGTREKDTSPSDVAALLDSVVHRQPQFALLEDTAGQVSLEEPLPNASGEAPAEPANVPRRKRPDFERLETDVPLVADTPGGSIAEIPPYMWWPENRTRVHKISRHHGRHAAHYKNRTFKGFVESARVYEWVVFSFFMALAFKLHFAMDGATQGTRLRSVAHAVGLGMWIVIAIVYWVLLWFRLGKGTAVDWLAGYTMELLFSLENVAVFHAVVRAFRTPTESLRHAIFMVVCCEIFFQMVLYMGLAHQLRHCWPLPYVLGAWLLYMGFSSVVAGHSLEMSTDSLKETNLYRLVTGVFGSEMVPEYSRDGSFFLENGDGRRKWSLLAPVVLCLVLVDFALEIDVTLTKVELLDNEYIAFSSSALAAFAVPELFFVFEEIQQRYQLVDYGIAFILIFFGGQMLLHQVVDVPEVVSCLTILAVMATCVLASSATGQTSPRPKSASLALGEAVERKQVA